ncbi:MAG: hypothetical protein U0136_21310 [Bdellovibrionota bacterium]
MVHIRQKGFINVGNIRVRVCSDLESMGRQTTTIAKTILSDLARRDLEPFICWASAPSQHPGQNAIVRDPEILAMLRGGIHVHMDEYVGQSSSDPDSFSGDIQNRIIDHIGLTGRGKWLPINGRATDPYAEAARLTRQWFQYGGAPHILFGGVGEDNHLAFDAAPTEDRAPGYFVIDLPESTRLQQVREGRYAGLKDVPSQAITLNKEAYILARVLIMQIHGKHKAQAVLDMLKNLAEPKREVVASYLGRCTGEVYVLLDRAAASLAREAGYLR